MGNSTKFGAIPTIYKGIRFRSRLEATWAAMFDLMNWRWEYEPFDLYGYIPDFLVLQGKEFLVEVKPETSVEGCAGHEGQFPKGHEPILVVGCTPFLSYDDPCVEAPGDIYAGAWLQESGSEHDQIICADLWTKCEHCNRYTMVPSGYIPYCVLCAQEAVSRRSPWIDVSDEITMLWATAKNTVQWKGYGA